MSTPFYDLASLVVVPSGYKASKVYAQKPQTTDGQLAFTRASTATRVNASGLVASVATGVPRLDYLGSTCPKLLLEPQRSNLFLYSNDFSDANWNKYEVSITANSIISPDGTINSWKLNDSTNNTQHALFRSVGGITSPNAISFFVKSAEYSKCCIENYSDGGRVVFNIADKTIVSTSANFTSATIQQYANGFIRISATTVGTTGNKAIGLGLVNDLGQDSFVGTGTKGIYVYGGQDEAGAYATSYIPTITAAVTRVADACSKTGISSLIGQTEGTVFVEVNYSTLSGLNMFMSIRPDASNKVEVYRDGATIYGEITASSSFAIAAVKAVGTHKIAFAYKSGSSALYIDGVLVSQDATAFSFTSSLVDIAINSRSGGTFNEAANYKQTLLFKTRLTNAQLAELTTI